MAQNDIERFQTASSVDFPDENGAPKDWNMDAWVESGTDAIVAAGKARTVQGFETYVERNEKLVQEWAEKLIENPAFAFDWAVSPMMAAASVREGKRILNNLNSGCSEDDAEELLKGEILYCAGHPPASSSPVSNLMELFYNRARCEILDLLGSRTHDAFFGKGK